MSFDFLTQRTRIIDEHRRIILEMRSVEGDIAKCLKQKDPAWRDLEKERNALYVKIEPLIEEYWKILPAVEFSCCPFCRRKLLRRFDAVDLDGFWWMDRTQRPCQEPTSCEHFCLVTGALDFAGRPAQGGLFECLPGPDIPYVIPRLLDMGEMTAVVSCIAMSCGYRALPVVYFSNDRTALKDLTQSWAQKVFQFHDENGRRGWDIKEETPDYGLASWIKLGKLMWYSNGRLNDSGDDPSTVGFLNINGRGRFQVLVNNQLSFR